jgi:predicted glycosyltransferase
MRLRKARGERIPRDAEAEGHPALRSLPPRVLFYSHDAFGLGHIQRTLAIAASLARQRPEVSMLALTSAICPEVQRLPPSFDYVRLPARVHDGRPGGKAETATFRHMGTVRESIIMATAGAYRPQLLIVDELPPGLGGELRGVLQLLRRSSPRVEIVLALKDIISEPASLRQYWQTSGSYRLAEEVYDQILVFGDRRIGDPIADLEMSASVAAKTTFCGYLFDASPADGAAEVRARLGLADSDAPLIIVTVGGGADGAPVVRAYLEAVRTHLRSRVASFVTTGPLLSAVERDQLVRLAAGLPEVTIVPYAQGLRAYLEAADLVVAMGGYNTTCEVVGLGKRAIVVPRERWQEQVIRAERVAQLGLVSVLRAADLSPASLARSIESMLGSSPPPHDLDFGGWERVGAVLSQALDR